MARSENMISTESSNAMTRTRTLPRLAAVTAALPGGAFLSAAAVPRPEHPRPDLFRENRMTPNGEWQFETDKAAGCDSCGLTYGG